MLSDGHFYGSDGAGSLALYAYLIGGYYLAGACHGLYDIAITDANNLVARRDIGRGGSFIPIVTSYDDDYYDNATPYLVSLYQIPRAFKNIHFDIIVAARSSWTAAGLL
jgi:hypothetical protein